MVKQVLPKYENTRAGLSFPLTNLGNTSLKIIYGYYILLFLVKSLNFFISTTTAVQYILILIFVRVPLKNTYWENYYRFPIHTILLQFSRIEINIHALFLSKTSTKLPYLTFILTLIELVILIYIRNKT